jgi:hypothetical protein
MTCTSLCDIEPFSSEVEPQDPPTASSITIMRDEIQDYLARFREALCADLRCIDAQSYDSPLVVVSTDIDLPSVGSKDSASVDTTVEGVPLGTHVVSWAALTDATSIDDLMIQFMVVAEDTVRLTVQNPSAGAIDPDTITFQFALAQLEDT